MFEGGQMDCDFPVIQDFLKEKWPIVWFGPILNQYDRSSW